MNKICMAVILVLIFAGNSAAVTRLSFTTADDQTHGRAKAVNAVLTECLHRMGVMLEIIPMPSKRSLINVNSGIEDGNFVRTDGISLAYPNLIKVPERIAVNRIVAFSKNEKIQIKGWESLLNYHVAYVNGWRNCERELKQAKAKTIVKNEILLFTLLENDRADVGVFGRSTGTQLIKTLGYTGIKAIAPPIVTSDLFLYVHKKHGSLIPKIGKTLKSMKQDGTYQTLIDQHYPDRPAAWK